MLAIRKLLATLTLTLAIPAWAAMPDSQVVTAMGEGSERNAALNEAKRMAVEQAVGVYVVSETLTENFQVVKDSILTKASGYINNFKIVKEESKGGVYQATIEATVSVEPLVDQLGKLGLLRDWTVAVVLTHHQGLSPNAVDSARTRLNGLIVERGFRVADEQILVQLNKPGLIKEIQSGNYQAATELLANNGVDVMITGKASAVGTAGGAMETYGGEKVVLAEGLLDISAVRTETGEIIAAQIFKGKAGSSTELIAYSKAIEQASGLAGEYFVRQIAKLPAAVERMVLVVIKGVDFNKVRELDKALAAVEGVRKAKRQTFNNNMAQYELAYGGSADELAEKLVDSPALKKMKLSISSLSSGKITAQVK